jgi:hypothetical protein
MAFYSVNGWKTMASKANRKFKTMGSAIQQT